ncbi:MAG: RnfABCDGE type electron transport complex subunit G [Oscillospiraceae bacterium]|nr:RnfABCDGE type electron transport complex subunit G [Oscillospiraceae bacterium]
MNKILKLTLVLFLVCAIAAGALGVVNELTYRRIDAQQQAKTVEAFSAVMKADGYEEVGFDSAAFPTVNSVNHATNDAGYVVTSTFSGAQGNITLAVGVDNDYKCTGISVIEHSETSGLGANAASTGEVGVKFRAQFVGEDENIALSKSGGSIDALTGATITSRAITGAVAESIRVVKSLG